MVVHYQKHVDPTDNKLSSKTATAGFTNVKLYSLVIFISIALILLLMLLLSNALLRSWKKSTFYNILYFNIVVCSLLCACVARPMTILQGVASYIPSTHYCTAYVFILEIETVTIPLMLLMLTIERIFYFWCLSPKPICEKSYRKWVRGYRSALMVIVPWVAGLVLALIKTFGLLNPVEVLGHNSDITQTPASNFEGTTTENGLTMPNVTTKMLQDKSTQTIMENQGALTRFRCHMTGRSNAAHLFGEVILYTFRSSFPIIYLVAAWGLMLLAWWDAYYTVYPDPHGTEQPGQHVARGEQGNVTRTNGHPTPQSEVSMPSPHLRKPVVSKRKGFQEESAKTYATVWVGGILILWCICVSIIGSVLCKRYGWLVEDTQWLYFSLEVATVILACVFFPEIQQILFCKKVFFEKQKEKGSFRTGNPRCSARRAEIRRSEAASLHLTNTLVMNNNGNITDSPTPGVLPDSSVTPL